VQSTEDENSYSTETGQDEARRHRYLVKVIAAWAVAAVALMVWTYV
jgi:hypothetical protein